MGEVRRHPVGELLSLLNFAKQKLKSLHVRRGKYRSVRILKATVKFRKQMISN